MPIITNFSFNFKTPEPKNRAERMVVLPFRGYLNYYWKQSGDWQGDSKRI